MHLRRLGFALDLSNIDLLDRDLLDTDLDRNRSRFLPSKHFASGRRPQGIS